MQDSPKHQQQEKYLAKCLEDELLFKFVLFFLEVEEVVCRILFYSFFEVLGVGVTQTAMSRCSRTNT